MSRGALASWRGPLPVASCTTKFGARVLYALGVAWTLLLLLGFVAIARRQGRLGSKEQETEKSAPFLSVQG